MYKIYNICGCSLVLSGIVVLIIGVTNIPSQMPPIIAQTGESQQDASDRTVRDYNQSIINSKGFLLAMIGTGLICLSLISLAIMLKRFNDDILPIQQSRVHPETKVHLETMNLSPKVAETTPPQPRPKVNIYELYPPKPHITVIRSILKATGKNESKVTPMDII